jgi:hypothetical protein
MWTQCVYVYVYVCVYVCVCMYACTRQMYKHVPEEVLQVSVSPCRRSDIAATQAYADVSENEIGNMRRCVTSVRGACM